MRDFNKTISQKIRDLLNINKINHYILCGLLDLKPSAISELLKGRSNWQISHITILAEYFGITLDELVFGEKNHISEFNKEQIYNFKKQVKDYLVREKKFTTYGKLTADGYFKELEE